MVAKASLIDLEGISSEIADLDFTAQKNKMMLPAPEGKGWSKEQADIAEMWYKRYLHLLKKYPNQKFVPNAPIDAFWHYHILDTRRYAEDCKNVFGKFLHHNPYYGLKGDAEYRDEDFDKTNQFYRIEFGTDCTTMFDGLHAQTCESTNDSISCSNSKMTAVAQTCESTNDSISCSNS